MSTTATNINNNSNKHQHHHHHHQGASSSSSMTTTTTTKSSSQETAPASTSSPIDLDTLLQNDNGRKLFALYLKEFNTSVDNLLTLYLICSCFQNQRIDDRTRIKQILEKTYQACFVRNQLPYLNVELKQKLCDTLKRSTYNESIFNAVKREIKHILESGYFPGFLKSKMYKESSFKLLSQQQQHQPTTATTTTNMTTTNGQTQQQHKPSSNGGEIVFDKILKPFGSTGSHKANSKLNRTSLQPSNGGNSKLDESTLSLKPPSSNYNSGGGVLLSTSQSSFHLPMPVNPYSILTKPIPVSCQDSEIQSILSEDEHHHPYSSSRHMTNRATSKLDKHIKQNLQANKNVKLHLPDTSVSSFNFSGDQWNDHVPLAASLSNPNPNQAAGPGNHHNSNKRYQTPISESDPQKFFEILSAKLEKYQMEQSKSAAAAFSSSSRAGTKGQSFSTTDLMQQQQHHESMPSFVCNSSTRPLECDFQSLNLIADTHIDEHLNHISKPPPSQHRQANFYHINKTVCSSSGGQESKQQQQQHNHHFYQLTSKSKEVDIDSQNNNNTNSNGNHFILAPNVAASAANNYDSGLSATTKSIDSIERVNDWLSSNSKQSSNNNHNQQTCDVKQEVVVVKKAACNDQQSAAEGNVKITVAYYLPGEELAYISTFNGKHLTLAQFKQLITKRGNFRYFFKTKSDLLDEECVVYQEATEESSLVPMFNGKVIAKIEKN